MKLVEENPEIEIEIEKKEKPANEARSLQQLIEESWSKIAPCWPLKNIIATNPLSGFERLPFQKALKEAEAYFQQQELPEKMQQINRETIKWIQAFCDEGQATIKMPNRNLGFLPCLLSLLKFDSKIHNNNKQKVEWLRALPGDPAAIINLTLQHLNIPAKEQGLFLSLMLTTLPGWAAYIQYRTSWSNADNNLSNQPISQSEYLAFRLILTYLNWPKARTLIEYHQAALNSTDVTKKYQLIKTSELNYQTQLLKQLKPISKEVITTPKAQLLFCIDVRSEPFRRKLEVNKNYETYGVAGFFGVPIAIKNSTTDQSHASCPVLLKPKHAIVEFSKDLDQTYEKGEHRLKNIKKVYQSIKYTFTTPFNLVEAIGLWSGLWMLLKTFQPSIANRIKKTIRNKLSPRCDLVLDIDAIPLEGQITYGVGLLKTIGLTDRFAPLVVFFGHGSTTENNAHATSLDCGACGGYSGHNNARVLAKILNNQKVRNGIREKGINIPEETLFVAALHNTTTDEITLYQSESNTEQEKREKQIETLRYDLKEASSKNDATQMVSGNPRVTTDHQRKEKQNHKALRSQDWAELRPEWGLAKNAAFIIAPRAFTRNINLEGRAFLHSYEWEKDKDASALTAIMTAPMIVAQWINAQYLFSTLDNKAFGSGSKITQNISGKIGIMQGNASDLMHGLPLESVYESDKKHYHEPIRLSVVIYAPRSWIQAIIKEHSTLQTLFKNEWIHLICYEPEKEKPFKLQNDLTWRECMLP